MTGRGSHGSRGTTGPGRTRSSEREAAPGDAVGPTGPAEVADEEQPFYCDLCGARMLNLHCKLSCPRCGYKRDCSDP